MNTTLTPTQPTRPSTTSRRLDERKLAGIGGLTFAAVVIITNVLQGATPAMDASADDVVTYLTDHRTENLFATGAFAFGALFLLMFASAFYGRLKAASRPEDLVWARFGLIGALLILPTFATVVIDRIVLLVAQDEIIGSPELITLMWRFEMAAFIINTLPIAAAVLGFGVAGARAGLLPRWFSRWAPVASTIAVITAVFAVAGLEGSPVGFGGLIAFLTWMALLIIGGVKQLRSA